MPQNQPKTGSPKSAADWIIQNWTSILIALITGIGSLIFDFMTPLGVAAGVIYVLFILSAFGFKESYTAFIFASIATIFILTRYFLITEIHAASLWIVQLNRGLSVLALWIVAVVVYYQKISEERIVRESEKSDTITQTVLDGLITIDAQGSIQSFNPAAVQIFGYHPTEVIGQNVKMLMPNPYHLEHDGYLKNYLNTGDRKVIGIGREVTAKRKDGTIFPMELGINEMPFDGQRMFVGTIRDITERKNAQTAIHEYLERLERSNQELDDFAYIASHDLKEPLRGLANNALFLQEDYEHELDAGAQKRLNRMIYLCKRMERLVDDLLYFSRLGRQELAVQDTNLNEMIRDIESMTELTLQEQNAKIIVPARLPIITCDLPRVTELFRNLITNAIKYNDKDEKIIEIGVQKQGEHDVFYVKDNGIGIEERFFEDIFRIFKRLNHEDDNIKGTGVGLTFVKKIIERHKGQIWLESTLGEGTTFFFTINTQTGEKTT